MTSVAVHMQGIGKSFNGIRVLDAVDFELRTGEVHALVGGNGAGKSTLMKILEGVYTADEGQIFVDGRPATIRSAQDAQANGIAMIFQEFSLVPTLTVAQNIFLTREDKTRGGFLDDKASERKAKALFAEMGIEIDPATPVANLSTGYRQMTEIAKALSQNARILIMDEPTASLTHGETQSLFQFVGRLKAKGISIIYISHRMEEIFRIADRITVLRDGKRVLTDEIANQTMEMVIEHIVGRKMEQAFQWKERTVDRSGQPLLEIVDLQAGNRVRGVNLQVYAGEILGIAGLMGSGRTELARTVFGVDAADAGEVRIRGRRIRVRRPEDSIAAGIALIPEDRRAQGLVLGHSIRENVLLPLLQRIRRHGFVDDRAGDQIAASYVTKLNIRASSVRAAVRLLSGGNQQKVVVGKWLAMDPDVLILDEPTAGVDIGAKTEIVEIIRQLADAGKAVIVISSELPELLAVSDRIVVLRDGQVVRELDRRAIPTEEALHHILQGV